MHSLAMHADNRTSSKSLVSPKISGNTSPSALIRSQHLTTSHHHHPHHPHLVMPHAAHPLHAAAHHAALHHQHPNPYSLSSSLSLTPTTTESTTSSPTSSSHAQSSSNPSKYDLTSGHQQHGQLSGAGGQQSSTPSSGGGNNLSHHASSHQQQQQQQQHQQSAHQQHHEYFGHFGSAAAAAAAASIVKSETPGGATPNYDYMGQCYFGGGSVPASSSAGPAFGGNSTGAIASAHVSGDLAGYHHQHNVIQAAKLMASS